jgi:hypothetical protein
LNAGPLVVVLSNKIVMVWLALRGERGESIRASMVIIRGILLCIIVGRTVSELLHRRSGVGAAAKNGINFVASKNYGS